LQFKLNQDCRRHIPKQKHKLMNWRAYDASLRQRGSLTVWFMDEALEAWRVAPRATPGGQPWFASGDLDGTHAPGRVPPGPCARQRA